MKAVNTNEFNTRQLLILLKINSFNNLHISGSDK